MTVVFCSSTLVPLGLKRLPLKSTTYNTSQPPKKSLLESLDDEQFWYELLLMMMMMMMMMMISVVRIFEISNRIVTSVFDSKRAQLFEIFEYLPSPISYLFISSQLTDYRQKYRLPVALFNKAMVHSKLRPQSCWPFAAT